MFEKFFALLGYVKKKEVESQISNLNAKNQSLSEQIDTKDKENQAFKADIKDLSFKNEFVAKLLSAGQKNELLQRFHGLLYKDFFEFANKDDSLASEAQAFSMLQDIEKELEIISIYPELYSKAIIAVGGGFSSGKSAFISSFIDDDIMLPISVKPTTAISTFVISNSKITLNAFSKDGVSVNLSELDPQIHSKISHDFIKGFGFKLKTIMPFMVLQAPLVKNCEHLCFIDTPGYNAAHDKFTSDDKQSALEFVRNATALLWLVSIDNGTIKDDDIAFLNELDLSEKKLFIVLNKADMSNDEERKEVIAHIKDMLELSDIDYEGISAYSAKKKQEFEFDKMSLQEFFNSVHTASVLHKWLITQLFEVYTMYAEAISAKQAQKEAIYKSLDSLRLDLTEAGLDEDSPYRARLAKIQSQFAKYIKAKFLLEELKTIITKMQNVIDEIFGKHLDISLPNLSKDDKRLAKNSLNNKENTQKPTLSKEEMLDSMLIDACNGLYGSKEEAINQIAKSFELDNIKVQQLYEAKMAQM